MLMYPNPIAPDRVAQLEGQRVDPDIAAIDLEMVKMKLRDVDEGAGWNAEQCESAELEYKRFLHLNRKHQDAAIVPNKIIDTIWHFHILDTRSYIADSDRVFGRYFHHFPYFGMRGHEDEANLRRAFEATQRLYEVEFGEAMVRDEAQSCWHDCSGRCWHDCSSKVVPESLQ